MKIYKDSFLAILPLIFIISASFLGTSAVDADHLVAKSYNLPFLVSQTSIVLYYILMGFFLLTGFIFFLKNIKINYSFFYLICAYLILFFWSIVDANDQIRYFLIMMSVIFCPMSLYYFFNKINFSLFSKYLILFSFFIIIISTIFSYLNYGNNPRISGIHNNPNLMGMWLVSLLTIILYFQEYIKKYIILIIITCTSILVLLTGSRLAFCVLLLILIPFFVKNKIVTFIFFIVSLIYFLFGGDFINFRSVEVGSAVSDSGRIDIWEKAFICIQNEPFVGNGMLGAQNCVHSGNVHNSYLRVLVMLGIPLTLLFFIMYFYFIFKAAISSANIYIKFYLIGLPILFFAEDYIVGFASPFFPFFIFIISLYLYDLKKSINSI
ncbi:O-antigen ligase family protein [Acinetobacter sp. YH12245]|uniref:O-antigen ligase family protein n=1 Tax=Acinetobacter sp. YH12245 TaxID=2601171 RepID=UPI0015D0D483|nr:O-antigen ligase family protein [Acinetobacter sp. YH12245]